MELAVQIDQKHNSTIQYGPFKGMLLSRGDWWGKIDRPSMIYGFYEQEVLESLTKDRGKFKTMIDVGAADEYYTIGGIISKTFEKSICYEIAKEGQKQIRKNVQKTWRKLSKEYKVLWENKFVLQKLRVR